MIVNIATSAYKTDDLLDVRVNTDSRIVNVSMLFSIMFATCNVTLSCQATSYQKNIHGLLTINNIMIFPLAATTTVNVMAAENLLKKCHKFTKNSIFPKCDVTQVER